MVGLKLAAACLLLLASAAQAGTALQPGVVVQAAAPAVKVPKVAVMGLFSNSAVVQIDGRERILKLGKASPEGVTLLSADSKQAEIDNNGHRQTLVLNRGVGTRFSEPTINTVRIASQLSGHYLTPGRINNRAVEFLVDTGATSIAMNASTAKRLGLDLNPAQEIQVQTAQGTAKAYAITLESAAVGTVAIFNLEAVVMEGDYPQVILLGNSFLSRVDMKVEQGVMVLQTKF